MNERRLLAKQLAEIKSAPLQDRKQAQLEWIKAMIETPDTVAERVGWIINGSYGYGACMAAKQIVDNPRMNRVAALGQLVAALEWQCPDDMARKAWTRLTPAEQERVNAAILREMNETESAIA